MLLSFGIVLVNLVNILSRRNSIRIGQQIVKSRNIRLLSIKLKFGLLHMSFQFPYLALDLFLFLV